VVLGYGEVFYSMAKNMTFPLSGLRSNLLHLGCKNSLYAPGLCVGLHMSLSVRFCVRRHTYMRLYVRHCPFTANVLLKIAAML